MGVRFAPSPTGKFHLGNLRTAWIAAELAKRLGLPLVVRIEDIDRARNIAGAAEKQLDDMRALGIEPAETVVQSHFHHRHLALFEQAARTGAVYPCFCSRKDVVEGLASAPHGSAPVYTGHCRQLEAWPAYSRPTLAWRFKMGAVDAGQDFIVARTQPPARAGELPAPESFVPAYQWACAIDDFDGGYALLVRAYDLLESAPQQRAIQAWLADRENKRPQLAAVFHTALIVNDDFTRLEKRTKGVTLDEVLARGLRPADVIVKFKNSFDSYRYPFAPSAVFGEDKRQITLGELGF